MTASQNFNIRIIGERINPGFKSTKALFDNSDLPGIQALPVKGGPVPGLGIVGDGRGLRRTWACSSAS